MRPGPRLLRLVGLVSALLALSGCVFVTAPFGNADDALHETTIRGEGSAKILWLPISGFISDTPSRQAFGLIEQPSTLAQVSRALDRAETDDAIRAVVLRIDSPGGTVAAADEIYTRIRRYHEATGVPVIASFGGVAASGGYYVGLAADTLIAQPTTITGSIGVILVGVNTAGLLDKLGIENQSYTSGPHKDILSPLRPATAEERAIVQRVVDSLFARFVDVLERRRPDLDRAHLDTITDGRILAAPDARELGLVDTIGHIDDVIDIARERAGVDNARVIRYYRGGHAPATLSAGLASVAPQAELGPAGSAFERWLAHSTGPQPLYLWRGAELR